MLGVVPFHNRRHPPAPSPTTSRIASPIPIFADPPCACIRVFIISVGLHTPAATPPLTTPAQILVPSPASRPSRPSLPAMASFNGPYIPIRSPPYSIPRAVAGTTPLFSASTPSEFNIVRNVLAIFVEDAPASCWRTLTTSMKLVRNVAVATDVDDAANERMR